MSLIAVSVNCVPVRLVPGYWDRLQGYYDEILETVARPDYVLVDRWGDLVAVRDLGGQRCFQVTYREMSRQEGYIVASSYLASWSVPGRVIWRRRI